jgi:hypothetical protein
MNIRKIIKEELLKEVGGYDDSNVMYHHAGKVMYILSSFFNEVTNTIEGLANAIMDGTDKEDIVNYLTLVSEDIHNFMEVIKTSIKDFTEDDLISKAKMIIKSLNTFVRKIDVVINFSDAMGGQEEFIDKVKTLLMDLVPSIQEYGEQLKITNKMFMDRTSGHSRGAFGSGFSSN